MQEVVGEMMGLLKRKKHKPKRHILNGVELADHIVINGDTYEVTRLKHSTEAFGPQLRMYLVAP